MAKERLISAQPHPADPPDNSVRRSSIQETSGAGIEGGGGALRPTKLDDYVGQPKLIRKLRIALKAATDRRQAMEHVLLHGPPGLGKTTLAHIIANEMGTHLTVTSGPALTRPTDLVGALTKLQARDVLFIDEIHRLSPVVEEYLYSAMEDFKIDLTVDSGMHAKVITLPLQPFCLIGATTRAGLLSSPMRSRFGLLHNFDFYSREDLLAILHRSAQLLGMTNISARSGREYEGGKGDEGGEGGLARIADRCRGTPRIANRLLRRVRDFAHVEAGGRLDASVVDQALALEGIDSLGLDELDRKYLQVIAQVYRGGPVGLEAVAATLGEDAGTLEDVVEPYLLQVGFVARTRKGRQLTPTAAAHLGLSLALADESDCDSALFPPLN